MDIKFELNQASITMEQLTQVIESERLVLSLIDLSETLSSSLELIRCIQHGEPPEATIVLSGQGTGVRIDGCCPDLVDVGQAAVRKIFTSTQPIALQTILILTPEGTSNAFRLLAEHIETLVIGRLDPDTGIEPDICLRHHAAYEKGVSRRHAAITRLEGVLHIVDLGAANGTFLNGVRLEFNEPQPLKNGDTLRLGHFLVQVTLKVAATRRSG